jgi:repressor of nif and glnA expression
LIGSTDSNGQSKWPKQNRTETALNDIMLTAKSGLSMKQIMFKAKRKTGKEVSERTVRSHLKVLAETRLRDPRHQA